MGEIENVEPALQFGKDFKACSPEHVYVERPNEYFNSWVVKCRYNYETKQFEFNVEMKTSMYIIGSAVNSLCEYRRDSLLMSVHKYNVILVSLNYKIIHKIEIAGNISISRT